MSVCHSVRAQGVPCDQYPCVGFHHTGTAPLDMESHHTRHPQLQRELPKDIRLHCLLWLQYILSFNQTSNDNKVRHFSLMSILPQKHQLQRCLKWGFRQFNVSSINHQWHWTPIIDPSCCKQTICLTNPPISKIIQLIVYQTVVKTFKS